MRPGDRPGCVLVVDDDPDIRTSLRDVLEVEGYRVREAEDGSVALRVLREGTRPCVILLDLMMPVVNGWQLQETLAGDRALASIPVLLISGAGQLPAHAASMGASGYLTKPIDLEPLLEAVGRYC
jgi:CheY-like chemotaxis protein